jgi:glycosyltransferase involved in cell wall biosynthesis
LKAMVDVPTFHLAVCGTVLGSPYPALAAQLGVQDRVYFLGFRADMPDLMRAADMFVFPSRYEACSLAMLEALASGLPILTAITAGGAEMLTPSCGHVLTDPNDAKALAQTLRAWIGDPQRRRQMGQAARQVAEQHSWAHMVEAYLQLYTHIAEVRALEHLPLEMIETAVVTQQGSGIEAGERVRQTP